MPPSVSDIIEVSTIAELDGTEDLVNVFQFRVVTATWADEDEYLADLQELVAALVVWLKASASLLAAWKRFRARNITTGEAAVIAEMDTPVAGSSANDLLPMGVSLLVVFRTVEPRVVLRKFMGGQHELSNDVNGQWVSSTMTAAATFASGLMAGIATTHGGWQFGHVSGKTGVFLVPTSAYVSAEPAYQRRRRRGAGS